MNEIVNSIYKYETGIANFFEKKLLKSEKKIIRINKTREILQRWFSDEFEYNYSSHIYDEWNFYVFNNNELYTYSILFDDEELVDINLIKKYIIGNPLYYIKIEYNEMGIILTIFKHDSIKNIKNERDYIKYKEYYKDIKIASYVTYDYAVNKIIEINNNNITEVYCYNDKYKNGSSVYKYIYNDNYIYSYQEIASNYQSKFGRTYRLFLLFI